MATLPTGTVTFLFTDIAGSTHRWERAPAAMQAAVARHDAMLRDILVAHGGAIFKTVGDAFYAAFARPSAALEAAVSAQRALQRADWSAVDALLVRMALHSGVADERDADYFGPTLNRTARLLATAHGSQIVVSAATHALVCDGLPDGITLRALGTYQLKDLTRPEQIYQVVTGDLPAAFPPLNAPEHRRTNIPARQTAMIGREHEIEAVQALMLRSDVALVTLTGAGGTGKTRLAQALGARLLDHFSDGVWFVDLAPLTEPALVLSTIVHTLGLTTAPNESAADVLVRHLATARILLILDNFEQVVAAGSQLAAVYRAAERAKFLVTSRSALRLSGEHEYQVPPLALPAQVREQDRAALLQYAAVSLFVERAQTARPDLKLTDATARTIGEICIRLDGLPLALELAAARTKVLPPAALLRRLDQSLPLLVSGPRDYPARHQALRAAIDWSYRLLDPATQQLLCQLAVFAGGWTLAAAEAICSAGREVDAVEGLQLLLDSSLIVKQPTPTDDGDLRFTMLETLRQYAAEQLHSTHTAQAVAAAHAHYFLGFVDEAEPHLKGPDQTAWLVRIAADHDNIRAMLSWCIAQGELAAAADAGLILWIFWWLRGYQAEGQRWMEQIATQSAAEPAIAARASAAAGTLAWLRGAIPEATALVEASLPVLRAAGDRDGEALALLTLGLIRNAQGAYAEASALLEASIALYRALDDSFGLSLSLPTLAYIPMEQGDYQRALPLHEEGLAVNRRIGAQGLVAVTLHSMAIALSMLGDYERGKRHFAESIDISRKLSNGDLVNRLNMAGWTALVNDDLPIALGYLEEGVALARDDDDRVLYAALLHSLATARALNGELRRACALIDECMAEASQLNELRLIAQCCTTGGLIATRQGAPAVGVALHALNARIQIIAEIDLLVLDRIIEQRFTAETQAAVDDATWQAAWSAAADAATAESATEQARQLLATLHAPA